MSAATVSVRLDPGVPASAVDVELVPVAGLRDEWEVHFNGERLGLVTKYRGSVDRISNHQRFPGKTRTLWSADALVERGRAKTSLRSRADAIRWLLPGGVL